MSPAVSKGLYNINSNYVETYLTWKANIVNVSKYWRAKTQHPYAYMDFSYVGEDI